jgi:hypothetical protein
MMKTRTLLGWLTMAGGAMLSALTPAAGRPLLAKSPFEPVGMPAVAPANGPFEYVGFIETREGALYRLRNPARKMAAFVRLNVPNPELGVTARSIEAQSGALTVEHEGRRLTLPEPKAKVRSSGPPATSPPLLRPSAYPPQAAMPRAVTAAVVLNPTSVDETIRLEAVAAEIRRRQEERQKAARAAK